MENKKRKKILICGFSKSGTTIITKILAYCVNLDWQNEIKILWGISNYADVESFPDDSISKVVSRNAKWKKVQKTIEKFSIVKSPEAILVLNMFPITTKIVCVIRNPLDTICAYLERKHEFKTIHFSSKEIFDVAKNWNYHILSTILVQKPILFVSYEEFVKNQTEIIEKIAHFCVLEIKKTIPIFSSEQVQKYNHLVRGGQPIRGPGRFKLSIQDKDIINQVINICYPALCHLKNKGLEYNLEYQ